MIRPKILTSDIESVYEKDLYIGASTIIIKTKNEMYYISPLLFRQCLARKMNYVTKDEVFEIEYDVLIYINDVLNEDNK